MLLLINWLVGLLVVSKIPASLSGEAAGDSKEPHAGCFDLH